MKENVPGTASAVVGMHYLSDPSCKYLALQIFRVL